MKKELIASPGYKGGLGGRAWSPGIKVGPWLFLSGITSVDYEAGKSVGRAEEPAPFTVGTVDPEAQWRQVLTNIKNLVEAAGGTMADIVLANVFVTDMSYYTDYQWVRNEFFVEPYPVCTSIEVAGLVHPDWVLEIEVQAYIEEK
jgi:enamine deaminase RidA (YjgF/YER057c/UK114 family)